MDFQNYGIHPHGYWAGHGEPDWPALARPALDNAARVLAAARDRGLLVVHVGVAWREGAPEANLSAQLFARARPLDRGNMGGRVLRSREATSR